MQGGVKVDVTVKVPDCTQLSKTPLGPLRLEEDIFSESFTFTVDSLSVLKDISIRTDISSYIQL